VKIHFIRPGKPIENCYVESFNGKLCDERLNEHWFIDLDDAKAKIATWRRDYNEVGAPQLAWRSDAQGVFISPRTRSVSGPAPGVRSTGPWTGRSSRGLAP